MINLKNSYLLLSPNTTVSIQIVCISKTYNHTLYCLYNYKRSSLPRITTPRQLQRAFPFTNYNTSFPRQQNNQSHSHCSHFTDLFGPRHLPFATVCFLTDQIFTSLLLQPFPALSVSAFLNSICTRGRKQQSK